MATVTRVAEASWSGGLTDGGGRVSVGSGAFGAQDFSLAGRSSSDSAQTSPEELIAAAHASCLSMMVSAMLSAGGATSPEIRVQSACTEGTVGDAYRITGITLRVGVKGAGLPEDQVVAAVEAAAAECPVSALVRGNAEVTVAVSVEE